MKIDVMVASVGHLKYVKVINDTIDEAAKARGTGIARSGRIARKANP